MPARGTAEERWWLAGARAEAQARDEERNPNARELYEFVDEVTKTDRFGGEADLAWITFEVFVLAEAPLRQRLRWAWRCLRG
jgi:hypothetical protein